MEADLLKKFKLHLSIRLKLLGLIVVALAASLLSYLFMGTSLIIQDKVSYIYDYNLAQVRASSDQIEAHIQKVRSALLFASNLGRANVLPFLRQQQKALLVNGLLILRPIDQQRFEIESDLSGKVPGMKQLLGRLGWTPVLFAQNEIVTGALGENGVPLGIRAQDSAGRPLVILALIQLGPELFKGRENKFRLEVIDSQAQTLASTAGFGEGLDPTGLQELRKVLLKSEFPSGAKDWKIKNSELIVAYQRIPAAGLMVIGLISKKESFRAAETLIQRSAFLGVSILLLAIAMTYVFAKGLTRRIREMWLVTQKVGQGDFKVRVEGSGDGDEISGLAQSFNIMAGRIDELMIETAEKARMGKELETAQAVQSRFFPASGLIHSSVKLAGRAVPATECAGDWWQYVQIGDQLVVVLGDVTGHGVSSALVTAAAYGAFTIAVNELKQEASASGFDAGRIIRHMNTAIQAAGAGEATMTMILSSIDLRSGLMSSFSASHRPVYVYRKSADPDQNVLKDFHVLTDGRMPAIGDHALELLEPLTFQLKAGDVVFWYTDGLVECVNREGRQIGKLALLKMMARIVNAVGPDADQICAGILEEFKSFLGENARNPDDDTTLAVAVVPSTASF